MPEGKTTGRKQGFAANPQLAKEAGRKGGESLRDDMGIDYLHEIARKGGDAIVEKRGEGYMAIIGRRGVEARKRKLAAKRETAEALEAALG